MKWEYLVEKLQYRQFETIGTFLNERGADGWELIHVLENMHSASVGGLAGPVTTFLFKREAVLWAEAPFAAEDHILIEEP